MIDRRAMNHMDAETKLVHIRLEAWGNWNKGAEMKPYPEITLLGRVIEQGISGAAQGARPCISMPEQVQVTEMAVLRCPAVDQQVLREYYIKYAPVEIMARHCRMRIKQFQNVLKRARWRVGGYVVGYEERAA